MVITLVSGELGKISKLLEKRFEYFEIEWKGPGVEAEIQRCIFKEMPYHPYY